MPTVKMAKKPTWEPKKTVIDLYTERDLVKWYWRLLGILSASMILTGFLVFPTSFQNTTVTVASQGTLSIVAVILLTLGYSLSVALWFICSNSLFQLDVLFMPCLSSCVLGTLNLVIALGVHSAPKDQEWTTSSIVALVLALVSATIYAILSILTYYKIHHIRSRDITRRKRGDSETGFTLLRPEDDPQRQQLLRLLQQTKETDKASPSQSTYRIDIPENSRVSHATKTTPTYLAAPSTIYESQGRSMEITPTEAQFALMKPIMQEVPIDRKQQALERARERSRQSQSRDVSQGPPIIVNTRLVEDLPEIPLSERHPLERGEFIRGSKSKDEPYPAEGVYRPEDEEYANEDYAFDRDTTTEQTRFRGELEAEVIPRIVRVQTDGWPASGN